MRRRSVMGMLGLAPVAMASGAVDTTIPQPSTLAGFGSAAARMMPDYGSSLGSGPFRDMDVPELNAVERAQQRLEALRWRKAQGLQISDSGIDYYDCPCIESRKATSPAVKRLLQREQRELRELRQAERSVWRAQLEHLAPMWVRRWL